MICAAQKGEKDVVKLLIDKRADLEANDASGNTSLILAAKNGKKHVVELLLD